MNIPLKNFFKIKLNDLIFKSTLEKVLFLFFCIIVLLFLLIHGLSVLGININYHQSKELLRVTTDGSYAEYFQYMLLVGTCYFIILISFIEKKYLLIFPFFFYLLLDDFFRIHDNYSEVLYLYPNIKLFFENLSYITSIREKDFYELTFNFIPLFLFIVSLLIIKFDDVDKSFIKKYIFSVISLIFFAVIVDILGVKFVELIDTPKHPLNTLIYFFEEGGEMFTCSYIFVIFLNLYLTIKSKSNFNR